MIFFFLFFLCFSIHIGTLVLPLRRSKRLKQFHRPFSGKKKSHPKNENSNALEKAFPESLQQTSLNTKGVPVDLLALSALVQGRHGKVWLAFPAFLTDLTQQGQDRAAPGKATHSARCQQ